MFHSVIALWIKQSFINPNVLLTKHWCFFFTCYFVTIDERYGKGFLIPIPLRGAIVFLTVDFPFPALLASDL